MNTADHHHSASDRRSRLIAIGTATPAGQLSMSQALAIAARGDHRGRCASAIASLTAGTGIRRRGSVLATDASQFALYRAAASPDDKGPGTAERLAHATHHATALGEQACTRALDRAHISPSAITHIVTASCTVVEAPGFDQGLIDRLGLSPDVRRTHLGFMGCHAAINALAVAQALSIAAAGSCVLVCCVELCSLHMQYTDRTDQLIANALFADGAAAAVVTAQAEPRGAAPGDAGAQGRTPPVIAGFGSRIFRDDQGASTQDAMGWCVSDHGFAMTLDRKVPGVLRQGAMGWVDDMLRPMGLDRGAIGAWAIHPGGPRIVRAVCSGLGLDEPQRTNAERDALDILESHGNMSSATVLFILDHLEAQGRPRPWVALAFGPGLAGEGAVFV